MWQKHWHVLLEQHLLRERIKIEKYMCLFLCGYYSDTGKKGELVSDERQRKRHYSMPTQPSGLLGAQFDAGASGIC